MNLLSILIYFGDITENMSQIAIGFITISVVMITICGFVGAMAASQEPEGFEHPTAIRMLSFAKKSMWGLFASMVVFGFIPAPVTVYMIAGSEVGEAAVTSEAGQRIIGKIESVLDQKLSEMGANVEDDEE